MDFLQQVLSTFSEANIKVINIARPRIPQLEFTEPSEANTCDRSRALV